MKNKIHMAERILFTVIVLAVNIILCNIPVPGLDGDYMKTWFSLSSALGFADTLSGGAMSSMGIAGFGISSYITATIVLQLLAVAFPALDQGKRGEHGRKTMQKVSVLLSMVITLAGAVVFAVASGGTSQPLNAVLAVVCWLFGTFIVVTLALKVEDYGVGNGVSLVLMSNILSCVPEQLYNAVYISADKVKTAIIFAVLFCVLYLIVAFLQKGVLNIPLIQSQKPASVFNDTAVLPIPVNVSNVLPVVYASVILALPAMVVALGGIKVNHIVEEILMVSSSSNWYRPAHWYYSLGIVIYLLLVWFFCRVSSKLAFQSAEVADRMKRAGDVIEGIAPGPQTIAYLERRRKIMAGIGFLFLSAVSIVPDLICSLAGIQQVHFLGTSMIIVCGVISTMWLEIKAARIRSHKRYRLFSV